MYYRKPVSNVVPTAAGSVEQEHNISLLQECERRDRLTCAKQQRLAQLEKEVDDDHRPSPASSSKPPAAAGVMRSTKPIYYAVILNVY